MHERDRRQFPCKARGKNAQKEAREKTYQIWAKLGFLAMYGLAVANQSFFCKRREMRKREETTRIGLDSVFGLKEAYRVRVQIQASETTMHFIRPQNAVIWPHKSIGVQNRLAELSHHISKKMPWCRILLCARIVGRIGHFQYLDLQSHVIKQHGCSCCLRAADLSSYLTIVLHQNNHRLIIIAFIN